jgi:hypothetical protein
VILRAALGLVVAAFALFWLLLGVAFSGVFDDAGARLLFDDDTYGYCSGDAADWLVLPVALLGVAAVAGAVVLRRLRRRLAVGAAVLFVAWVGIWAAGGCGMGSDDGEVARGDRLIVVDDLPPGGVAEVEHAAPVTTCASGAMTSGPKGRVFGFPPYSRAVQGVAIGAFRLQTYPVALRDGAIWLRSS